MKLDHHKGVTVMLAAALLVAGCSQSSPGTKDKTRDAQAKANLPGAKGEATDAKHAGWWCEEHGVPEHLCSLCSSAVAAKLKKEGDWCKIHDRAQSQCFKCDPSKYAKYEAMYEVNYGKKPPRPPEEEFQK